MEATNDEMVDVVCPRTTMEQDAVGSTDCLMRGDGAWETTGAPGTYSVVRALVVRRVIGEHDKGKACGKTRRLSVQYISFV